MQQVHDQEQPGDTRPRSGAGRQGRLCRVQPGPDNRLAPGVQLAEDELDDPRSLALPDWDALEHLAAALVARSAGQYPGWGDVVEFTACTAALIGETSGVRRADIDRKTWIWHVRRQTTPGPGG